MLSHLIHRVRQASGIHDIVVATSTNIKDDPLQEFCEKEGMSCFRGSEDDVLGRFFVAAVEYQPDIIIRICGDNPLISIELLDSITCEFQRGEYDFVSGSGFPLGCSSEGFTLSAFDRILKNARKDYHREHIVTYVVENPKKFRIKYINAPPGLNRPDYRLTVDTEEDMDLVREIYGILYKKGGIIPLEDVINLLDDNPELLSINEMVVQKDPFSE